MECKEAHDKKCEIDRERNCEPTLKEKRSMERYEGAHNFFRGNGFKIKSNYKNKRK